MNSNLFRVVVGLLLTLPSLLAQTPSAEGGIRFRTFGWQLSADDLYYEVKGRDTRISVTDSARSVFNLAPKGRQIVFYRLVPGPDDKPLREQAATVDIAAAGPWPLLIFTNDPKAPKRYRVAAIADDLKVFPFPSCRFVNFSQVDLYARFGDQKIKLPAKGVERIDPHLKSATETETRYITVSMDTPEGPRLLYSNNWAVRPSHRTLVFIFPQDEQLQIMRIADDIALYAPTAPAP
ncbi:MAG: hypothetical protein Q8Q59_15175 [Luteolibacter sp.]|jgi:hypothetical protein|nr:hypothetical protein [Luteolibacter sp.]